MYFNRKIFNYIIKSIDFYKNIFEYLNPNVLTFHNIFFKMKAFMQKALKDDITTEIRVGPFSRYEKFKFYLNFQF